MAETETETAPTHEKKRERTSGGDDLEDDADAENEPDLDEEDDDDDAVADDEEDDTTPPKPQKKPPKPEQQHRPPQPQPTTNLKARAPVPPLTAANAATWLALTHANAAPTKLPFERELPSNVVIRSSTADSISNAVKSGLDAAKTPLETLRGKADPKRGPAVVFVSSSTDRAVDALHEMAEALGAKHGAKMWARHMKLEEQASFLRERGANFACGTANRVLGLSRDGALSTANLKVVVVDCVPDSKSFTVCSLPGACEDMFAWLREFLPRDSVVVVELLRSSS